MRFRNTNVSSFQPNTARGRRKVRANDTPTIEIDSVTEGSIPSLQLTYEPPQVWSQHVIPLVLDKFSVAPVEASVDSSMFATIPRIVSIMQEGSPVYAVCNAIACAYFASTTGSPAAAAKRALAYGSALNAVNAALNDHRQCKNDSTLLAIWMFVVYEFLSNPHLATITGVEDGLRHARGMASLITLRGSDQFSRQDRRNLVYLVCHCTQVKALFSGGECSIVLNWLHELQAYVQPSEHIMIQACTYCYHCSQLYNRIRNVLNGDLHSVSTTHSSILEQFDETEKLWSSSFDLTLHSALSSIAVYAYAGDFRMQLSALVLTFLHRTCPAGCSQQHDHSTALQERCVTSFHATVGTILQALGTSLGSDHYSPSKNFNLGWGDAVMVYGSLRTMVISELSLEWQRNVARKGLSMIREQLGFIAAQRGYSSIS